MSEERRRSVRASRMHLFAQSSCANTIPGRYFYALPKELNRRSTINNFQKEPDGRVHYTAIYFNDWEGILWIAPNTIRRKTFLKLIYPRFTKDAHYVKWNTHWMCVFCYFGRENFEVLYTLKKSSYASKIISAQVSALCA